MLKPDKDWYLPEFKGKPFQLLLKTADDYYASIEWWKDNPPIVAEKYHKLDAVVSLMEHIIVHDIGLGLDGRLGNVVQRYKTFKGILRVKPD